MTKEVEKNPWLKAYLRVADGQSIECPNCGASTLRLRYVGDPATRFGYAILWCETCKKAFHLSRVRIPDDAPMADIHDPKANDGIPDVTFVDPNGS